MAPVMPYNASMRGRKLWLLPLILMPWGCNGGDAVSQAPQVPIQTLLSSIPEELRYKQPDVVPEENGWLTLSKGFDQTPRLDQKLINLLEIPGETLSGPKNPKTRAEIESVFKKYEAYLSTTQDALAKNPVSVLDPKPGDNAIQVLSGLRVQLYLFSRRAALRLAAGDVDRAISDYDNSMRIVRQLSSSGAPINYAVIATSLWARVDRDLRWAACHPKMTEEGLLRLLQILPEDKVIVEDFRRSIKSELDHFVHNEVQRLQGPGGNSLRDRDAKETYRDFDSGWDQADAVAAQVLEGHERPFDRVATVDSAAQIFQELLKNLERPWSKQVDVTPMIVSLVHDWPVSRLVGNSPDTAEAKAEFATSRPKLLKAENPYGKFAVWYFLPVSDHTDSAPFRARSDIRATRIVIANRIYKRRNGRLPLSLLALETTNILPTVPMDPFADQSFQFDPVQGKLSSPGPNIDARSGNRKAAVSSQDYVWYCNDLVETAPRARVAIATVPFRKRPLIPGAMNMRVQAGRVQSSP